MRLIPPAVPIPARSLDPLVKTRAFGMTSRYSGRGLHYFQDAVGGDVMERLHHSGGPVDFDLIRLAVGAEAEVDGTVAGRGVADAGGHVVVLCADGLAYDFDARADAVTIAFDAAQGDVEPVAGFLAAVHPDFGVLAKGCGDYVDAAVAVEVAEGAAAVAGCGRSDESGFFGQRGPFSVGAKIAEDRVELIDGLVRHSDRFHVAARHEQVFPTVVIEVVEAGAKAGHLATGITHAALRGDFAKVAFACVLKKWEGLVV